MQRWLWWALTPYLRLRVEEVDAELIDGLERVLRLSPLLASTVDGFHQVLGKQLGELALEGQQPLAMDGRSVHGRCPSSIVKFIQFPPRQREGPFAAWALVDLFP